MSLSFHRPSSPQSRRPSPKTSWEGVSDWYADYLTRPGTVQREIIFPGVMRLLCSKTQTHHLDIACGEGSFAAYLLGKTRLSFTGIDASPSLIAKAQKRHLLDTRFLAGDAKKFRHLFPETRFDTASCILALQNIDDIKPVFQNTSSLLKTGAAFVFVLNQLLIMVILNKFVVNFQIQCWIKLVKSHSIVYQAKKFT